MTLPYPIESKGTAMNLNMEQLEPLIGDWEMKASHDGQVMMAGTCTFAWSPDGPYLVQRADGEAKPGGHWEGHLPFPTVGIKGYDGDLDRYSVLYSDARDVQRIYEMTFADGVITQQRDAPGFFQRYSAQLSADGSRIDSRWERSEDGEDWFVDFELTYTRAA
jgi:hypothetical protein